MRSDCRCKALKLSRSIHCMTAGLPVGHTAELLWSFRRLQRGVEKEWKKNVQLRLGAGATKNGSILAKTSSSATITPPPPPPPPLLRWEDGETNGTVKSVDAVTTSGLYQQAHYKRWQNQTRWLFFFSFFNCNWDLKSGVKQHLSLHFHLINELIANVSMPKSPPPPPPPIFCSNKQIKKDKKAGPDDSPSMHENTTFY